MAPLSTRFFLGLTLLVLAIVWSFTVTEAQYETPNNMCGGYFRFIEGKINFTFQPDHPDDRNKICVWTVAPTRMYTYFEITRLQWPKNLPCNEYSVVINGFEEQARDVSISNRFCGTTNFTAPLHIKASVLVITLMVRSVQYVQPLQGEGFIIEYKRRSNEDMLPAIRMIETYYSWGRPSVDPLPYFAAGFFSNGMKTFAWPKANYSDGTNYEFHMTFDYITFDDRHDCTDNKYDFMMLCYFDNEGRLKMFNDGFYENRNVTDTAPFVSHYGMFIIYWGGECRIGGGAKLQLYYEHIRIA